MKALRSPIGRAVVLVPVAMTIWWFLLKGASLWLLRAIAYLPLGLLIAPAGLPPVKVNPNTGEWVFNVAVNTVAKNTQSGQMERIESVEFSAAEDNVASFASGWFCYLALALSATAGSRTQIKSVLRGLGLQTGINILALAAYAYINGYGSVINTPGEANPLVWLFKYFYHIIYLVVPFAGPFLVAVLVHPEWRAYFGAPMPQPQVSPAANKPAGLPRRRQAHRSIA